MMAGEQDARCQGVAGADGALDFRVWNLYRPLGKIFATATTPS